MSDAAPGTVTVTINGQAVEAAPGELVIAAAERTGTYIPRFCYHPRMESVGMCRMCVVDIDTGRGPALQPACMIPVADGMVVDTESDTTRKAQDGVLEFLLLNHPLDCPVCDKGGECPLQDQTMAYGPGESRFVEEKRHYPKPIPISELVQLDRERCILCDRCTRFASDVAGDPLISFIDRGSQTQVNTFPEHEFASYFSGNTVQICPVGALLAKPYRFKARPWDLDQVESTCTSCSVGCRVVVQASRNEVLRYQGVDSDPVNWGWLCDKGRFDFAAVNHPDRLSGPLVRGLDGALAPASWAEALDAAARAVSEALDRTGPTGIAVLGGARGTNEAAYAWAKLAKGCLGTDHVDAQLGDGLPAPAVLGMPRATIDDVCAPGSTVVLLAADLKEELPVLFLRLRHAVRHDGVRVLALTSAPGPTSELADRLLVHQPAGAAEVVKALLDPAGSGGEVRGVAAADLAAARDLLGDGPLRVVLGRANLAESPDAVIDAALALGRARPGTTFLSALRRGNVHGALDMGLAPGVLPGRVALDAGGAWFEAHGWARVPDEAGLDAVGILDAAANGRIDVLVLLGADPLADVPDRDLAVRGLAGARTVIALDTFRTESVAQADVVLAAAGYGEVAGSTTNLEGRVSHLSASVTPPGTARPDWMLAVELAARLGHDLGFASSEEITDEVAAVAPAHLGLTHAVLTDPAHRDGLVVPLPADPHTAGTPEAGTPAAGTPAAETAEEASDAAGPDPSEPDPGPAGDGDRADGGPSMPALLGPVEPSGVDAPAPDAYSLRIVAVRRLYDLGVAVAASPALAGLARPATVRIHPHDFERLGVAAGDPVSLRTGRGSVSLPVEIDGRVPRGTAVVTVNQPGAVVTSVLDATAPVTDARVEVAS